MGSAAKVKVNAALRSMGDKATHVAKITDSVNLSSIATHNPLFGKAESTTDTNGNQRTLLQTNGATSKRTLMRRS